MFCVLYPMLERRHKFSGNRKLVCSFDSFISFSCIYMIYIYGLHAVRHTWLL